MELFHNEFFNVNNCNLFRGERGNPYETALYINTDKSTTLPNQELEPSFSTRLSGLEEGVCRFVERRRTIIKEKLTMGGVCAVLGNLHATKAPTGLSILPFV